MTERFIVTPQPIRPAGVGTPGQQKKAGKPSGPSFDAVLKAQQTGGEIRFSQHAQSRMQSRGITFSGADLDRLNQAVDQVQAKGGKDSLVLLDETALVVSVKNSTVVTVVDRQSLQGNVFTNIDSAVIA